MKYTSTQVVKLVCDAVRLLETRGGMYVQDDLAGILDVVTDAVRAGRHITAEQVVRLRRHGETSGGSTGKPSSIEICAGGGGQALGLEQAGFEHVALVEIDPAACKTLRHNRPQWPVLECDLHTFNARPYQGLDLLAGGVPCPPFSVAGKQLGEEDERDLFPAALRLVRESRPKAVMLENVRGILDERFAAYRRRIVAELEELGYASDWRLLNASDYGVPQLRPRAVLVAMQKHYMRHFKWPEGNGTAAPVVGDVLYEEMRSRGWEGAAAWCKRARRIAPTLVGGSKKHGGPDLGPTRARKAWAELGIDGLGLADEAPPKGFTGMPRLTVKMTALLQGFPPNWHFVGSKTQAYRQVGNAFPPPVARAVGVAIARALQTGALDEEETRLAGKTA